MRRFRCDSYLSVLTRPVTFWAHYQQTGAEQPTHDATMPAALVSPSYKSSCVQEALCWQQCEHAKQMHQNKFPTMLSSWHGCRLHQRPYHSLKPATDRDTQQRLRAFNEADGSARAHRRVCSNAPGAKRGQLLTLTLIPKCTGCPRLTFLTTRINCRS